MIEASVLEKAAKLCLKNARQLIKDAEFLYSFKSYGHALGLTVLSDVELGKAVIYHLWSKGLISGETLPPPLQACFWERQYGLFASKTWWVGLAIASNVEELVRGLLDASEAGEGGAATGEKFSSSALRCISEIIERMRQENNKLAELEDYGARGFFVNFSVYDASVTAPDLVERSLVKNRIQMAKHRIRIGTPFLSLSLSDVPRRIAQILLEEAFLSVLPLQHRISTFTLPFSNEVDQTGTASKVLQEGEKGVE